jgi:CHAT domain-containing protein
MPDDSTALVAYVTGRRGEPTTAFVVTRRGVRVVPLTPVDSLLEPAGRFAALLTSGGPAEQPAVALGRAVLDPVVRVLPAAIRRLLIVPDDVLHHVPFDALRLGDGRYAIERFTIAMVPSAAVAMALWERPAHTGPATMLAFGDPRFGDERAAAAGERTRAAFQRGGGLARLAASGREARAVARYAAYADVRLGARATEHHLKSAALRGVQVLHFATHALVDDRSLTSTALALAPGAGEDGFVSPADIAALPLDAELVVLSACRTAGGVLVGGEGMQGLATAFLGAGARAVAATSWQIDDRRAAHIAGEYYRALADGMSLGDALRAAKLARLRDGAPPSEWAAWTLVGDPLGYVNLRPPRSRAAWWITGTVLVLSAIGAGVRRRRGPRRASGPMRVVVAH